MSWAKLDDRSNEHRKQHKAGAEACWLWACGLMYANRQPARDGFIPDTMIRLLFPFKKPERLAERLVAAGLWDKVDGGWVVHDFTFWNKTKEQVEQDREAARERMRRVRANRERTSGEPDAKFGDGSGSTPTPIPSDSNPDQNPLAPLPGGQPTTAPKARKPRSPDRTLAPDPETFELNETDLRIARENNVENPITSAKTCLSHHRGKGSLMADWHATVQTWYRNEAKFRRNSPPPGLETAKLNAVEERQVARALRSVGVIGGVK